METKGNQPYFETCGIPATSGIPNAQSESRVLKLGVGLPLYGWSLTPLNSVPEDLTLTWALMGAQWDEITVGIGKSCIQTWECALVASRAWSERDHF